MLELKIFSPQENGFVPEIKWNNEELKAAIAEKMKEYKGLVFTEETISEGKKDRANLNKLRGAIDDERKRVKKLCMEPCNRFEKEVKEVAEAMSNYAGAEKSVILKRVKLISIIGLISLVIGLVMEAINYDSMIPIYECMKGTCLGLGVGALATMVLYTTGILEKIKNRKSKQMKIVAIFGSGIIAICIIVSLILTIIEFLS